MDGVLRGLLRSEGNLVLTELRGHVHHAMGTVKEVCEGVGIHRRKRDMIPALFV